jgi:outer membrane receptor protein involved in Fe transport
VPLDGLLVGRASSDDRLLQRLLPEVGEPKFQDVIGDLRWTINSTSAISAGWLLLYDHVAFGSAPGDEIAKGSSRDSSGWLRWDWSPSGAVKSYTSLAVTDTERHNSGTLFLAGLAQGRFNAERSFSNIALQSDWTHSSPGLVLNFGGEFSHEKADLWFSRHETFEAPIALSLGRPLDASIKSGRSPQASMLGWYSSAHRRWRVFEAEIGVRIDAQDYNGYGVRSQVSPRVNIRYDLTDRWHAYGSWGQFTQAQRVDEYRMEADQKNPDSSSRAQHSIIGITHEGAATNWRLEAYRHHWSTISAYFDNSLGSLSILPELEPDRVLVVPTDADSAGAEISAQRPFGHGLSAWGSYSLSRVTDDVNGREVLRSWDQKHAANLGISWSKRSNSASVLFGWHSGWPRTPLALIPATPSQPASLKVGPRNSSRWASYFSIDLRLSTIVSLPSGELSLWMDGTNITNKFNYCCIDLNSTIPPGSMPLNETLAWVPRVINVGFSWRVGRP